MAEYDVVIPMAKKDIGFIKKVIGYVKRYLVGCNKIFIITNQECIAKLKSSVSDAHVELLNENTLIPGLSFCSVKKYMQEKGETCPHVGWYFQQFLKFAFAYTEHCKGYYLTWDADTLPLKPICFFEEERPLFTTKFEYHKPYFSTIEKLTGMTKTTDFSFIAEHMLFRKDLVIELVNLIGNGKVEGENWVQKCINACDDLSIPSFSEFETYGTYVWSTYPGLYGTQRLNTFRSAGFIKGRWIDEKTLNVMSFDLDTASFELGHEPVFPYNLPNIYYRWKGKCQKVASLRIIDVITILITKLKSCFNLYKKDNALNINKITGGG